MSTPRTPAKKAPPKKRAPSTIETVARRGDQLATLKRLRQDVAARMTKRRLADSDYSSLALRLQLILARIEQLETSSGGDEMSEARERRRAREQARPPRMSSE